MEPGETVFPVCFAQDESELPRCSPLTLSFFFFSSPASLLHALLPPHATPPQLSWPGTRVLR